MTCSYSISLCISSKTGNDVPWLQLNLSDLYTFTQTHFCKKTSRCSGHKYLNKRNRSCRV